MKKYLGNMTKLDVQIPDIKGQKKIGRVSKQYIKKKEKERRRGGRRRREKKRKKVKKKKKKSRKRKKLLVKLPWTRGWEENQLLIEGDTGELMT